MRGARKVRRDAAKRDELSHAQLACDVSRSHRFRRAPRAVPDLRWTKTSVSRVPQASAEQRLAAPCGCDWCAAAARGAAHHGAAPLSPPARTAQDGHSAGGAQLDGAQAEQPQQPTSPPFVCWHAAVERLTPSRLHFASELTACASPYAAALYCISGYTLKAAPLAQDVVDDWRFTQHSAKPELRLFLDAVSRNSQHRQHRDDFACFYWSASPKLWV
mmetsp:Transcript_55095/g.120168  ORF Transcript_55095/g.120168 Transcript_55095/m.120168 type:complete len:217 (-) Transcript_55095:360-1010(-)